jgi:hypothetical protein
MYVELIVDPSTEVWYGLVEFDWPEEEIEYEEPEFRRRTHEQSESRILSPVEIGDLS